MLRVVSNLAIIVSPKFRAAGVYFARLQSPSPKLETTRSLLSLVLFRAL